MKQKERTKLTIYLTDEERDLAARVGLNIAGKATASVGIRYLLHSKVSGKSEQQSKEAAR